MGTSKQRDVLLRLVHVRPGLKSSRDSNSFMSDFLSNMIRLFSEGYTLFIPSEDLALLSCLILIRGVRFHLQIRFVQINVLISMSKDSNRYLRTTGAS